MENCMDFKSKRDRVYSIKLYFVNGSLLYVVSCMNLQLIFICSLLESFFFCLLRLKSNLTVEYSMQLQFIPPPINTFTHYIHRLKNNKSMQQS